MGLVRDAMFDSLNYPRTISDVDRRYNFEFLPDPWVEEAVEIKSIRAFFPSSQIRYFISVYDMTLGTELTKIADFRIYSSEEETTVRDRTIAHVAWSIIPS